MNTDTPETDAERRRLKKSKSYPTDPVPADFARKLERERNAAREALSGRTVFCSQCNEAAQQLEAMCEAIQSATSALEDWQLLWREIRGQQYSRAHQNGAAVNTATAAALAKLQPFLKP